MAVKSIPKHLEGAGLAYFQANGTYPPFVGPESTAEDIKKEIEKPAFSLWRLKN